MSYGIGRIPADSDDDYYEAKAKIKALEKGIDPLAKPAANDRTRRCPQCGVTGRAGGYPFSTYGAMARGERQICDDCGA